MDPRTTLKKNHEFRRMYAKGESAVTPYMVVYAMRSRQECRRVGFTVSTKLGGAVVRNRARRRLREIYRLNSDRLKSGVDIIIVARARCLSGDFGEMSEAFVRACGRLGLLKGDD